MPPLVLPLNDIVAITNAIYQCDLARLQAIAAEEAGLRQQLDDLRADEQRGAAEDPDNALALRQIGGDILWKAWIGRKREVLNLQLATVLARKLTAAQTLRQSFGKSSVAEELRNRSMNGRKAEAALKALTTEQAHMVLQANTNTGRPLSNARLSKISRPPGAHDAKHPDG